MHCHSEDTREAVPAARAVTRSAGADNCCDAAIRAAADAADRRLLKEISAGSRSALGRLHSVYFVRLVKFFTYLLPCSAPEAIDDLIADTLFDVWRTRADLGSDCSIHVAIMRLAWTNGRRCLIGSETCPLPEERPSRYEHGESYRTGQSGRVGLLSKPLGTPAGCDLAVIHLVYAGNSRQEVADILGIPCESVDAHLGEWRRGLSRSVAIQCNDH